MKKLDPDANQLARTYIDDVELLLRSNSDLHVNEIDSLLSEINDFLHLRSRELSKGDNVSYREVLEAIDECGSPSEIVKQYLEISSNEVIEPLKPIKDKPSSFNSMKQISKLVPSIITKSRKDIEREGVIKAKSSSSDLIQNEKNDNIKYLTHSCYKKYENKKKVEKWIFLSCISVIGGFWVPFLAFYWLVSLKDAESKFMKSWEENKAFSSIFPYQPELRSIFTQNRTYRTNLLRINRIKTLFMLILIIPFFGYIFLLYVVGLMSLFTLGMAPLLAYYYLRGPKRHINILIEREFQLKSEETNNYNYLAFYNKAGLLSFDFDITTKIIRELNLLKEETILGVFQTSKRIIFSSFVIITNQQIINYSPPIISDYGERVYYLPRKQISNYHFQKKGRKVILVIESVDEEPFIIQGLDKKVVEPIQNLMNLLEIKYKKPDIIRLVQKKRQKSFTIRKELFICQVCESQLSRTTPNLKCDICSRYVCLDCFCQIAHEGRMRCPKCEGGLVSQ